MKTGVKGIELIKKFEGLHLKPYKCPAGYWTVGYGHMLTGVDKLDREISREEADELLVRDLGVAERAVGRLIRVALNQNQFDALVSFTFNLGSGALQRSSLRQKLNRGEFSDAAGEFEKWVYAGGQKLRGLVRRRRAEAELFMEAIND